MKVATVVGCRPQIIKAAVLSEQFESAGIDEVLINTGQHFSHEMAGAFFESLPVRIPDYNLNVNQCSHGKMTGLMIDRIEGVLIHESPDMVVLYGDTNSTLAGAIAASKMGIPICHVEAGLRSGNTAMPEEINRRVTDHVSDLLCCPTEASLGNLWFEGLDGYLTGDVMYDAVLRYRGKSDILDRQNLYPNGYVLVTVHRQENTNQEPLFRILSALNVIKKEIKIVFPKHPRIGCDVPGEISPTNYIEMLDLIANARVVLTDSGGVQREAGFLGVPCVVLRHETEWPEVGAQIGGTAKETILPAFGRALLGERKTVAFGDGDAGVKIVKAIQDEIRGL